MRKSILLVGPRARHVKTGVGVAFELLIESLEAQNQSVSIVNTQWGGAVKKSGTFNLKRAFTVAASVAHAWWKLPTAKTLYMPIATSNLGALRDFLIIGFAAMLRVRIVVHLHGSGLKPFYENSASWMQNILVKTYSVADCYVVLGELLKDQFSFVPNWETKTKVVRNGTPIDTSEIPESYTKRSPEKRDSWRFLFLSNLMPTKGYVEIVQACQDLLDEGITNFHCDLCGEFLSSVIEQSENTVEEQRESLLQKLRDPAIAGNVTYHGVVTGKQKTNFLRDSNLLLLPTYHPWEGQPLCINEALAWAMPVITTNHRGIPEQVIDGFNGYFVEPRSTESLVECLKQFLTDQAPYEQLSVNAREHFENCFTNEQHVANLLPLLTSENS